MVEWKRLGDICKVHTGTQLNRTDMLEIGPYPVVNGGREYSGYTDKKNEKANTITISQGGESAGYVSWINVDFWAGAHCYVVEYNDIFDNRYLYHTLKEKERMIQMSKQGAGIPGLNRETLYKQIIPIPTLAQQKMIVEILDTFTSSIENLKEQIAQRRKQYEYYRDKLMDVDEGPEARLITLDEVGTFERGCGIQKKDFSEDGIGCIHYGQIHTYYGISATQTISCISKELAKKCRKAKKGDVIIATTSEDVEGCAKAVAWLGDNEICISGDSYVFHHNENPKYVAYLFQLYHFQMFKRGRCTGTKVVRISDKAMSDYTFVLPIRQKQNEIVSVLDTFEETIRNLEEQLEQRQKQYEYYRNKLLTFD